MNKKNIGAVCLAVGVIIASLYFCKQLGEGKYIIDFSHRPSEEIYLYDYAKVLEGIQEYSNRYLKSIRDNYAIEALIVSLPSLGKGGTIKQVAVKIVDNWKIGKDYAGRGILLLLADKEKQVKLEVSFELEDVFTDLFCGYIEDLQLRPNFLGGQLGIGLLAVMEEIERRAQIKQQGNYTQSSIERLDRELVSGGAGAKRDLTKFKKEEVKDFSSKYPSGKTPEEAWERMKQSWRDKARDYNLGIYTEICKLLYRDYENLPDSRFEENVRTWGNKKYEVIQNGDYAVIFFGNKDGWDNSPFLFCKSQDVWKFDLVHQRKYVRMGPAPSWGIERANHPYLDLLTGVSYWMGQDMPLEGEDIYRIENDEMLAKKIKDLEIRYKNSPDDFETALELGKLYTITSMSPKQFSVLKKAKQLNSGSPLPYKYLAIAHVDANYQYKTAIEELKEYVKKEPQDVFGHNYLGYLYLCIDDYEQAIKELNKAIQLRPDNCYAYCKLSRCYGQLYLKVASLDPRRIIYKNSAIEMFNKAQNTPTPDQRRIGWLKYWLKEESILD